MISGQCAAVIVTLFHLNIWHVETQIAPAHSFPW